MIERIVLRNIQRHVAKEVEFGPAVTCLVGDTGAGKSTVMRTLYWLAFNKPPGNWMISHGEEQCRAVLYLDGTKIVRAKGRDVNWYRLGSATFKAIGQGVPEAVSSLLAVGTDNFQLQLDGPFWVTSPAAEVSRRLNAVVSLDVIDSSLAEASRQSRRAVVALELAEERLQEVRQFKASYAWVPAMLKDVGRVERLDTAVTEKRADLASVASDVERASSLTLSVQNADRARTDAAALKRLADEVFAKRERVRALCNAVAHAEELTGVLSVDVPSTDEVEALYTRRNTKRGEVARLEAAITHAEHLEAELCERERSATQKAATLQEESGSQCPLCGSRVSPAPSR